MDLFMDLRTCGLKKKLQEHKTFINKYGLKKDDELQGNLVHSRLTMHVS